MTKWVKQLTRENTLLDRSLRSLAYSRSIPQVGKARMAKCPVIGEGKITSLFYDSADYKRQQDIIVKEFVRSGADAKARKIIHLLETAYAWANEQKKNKFSRTQFPEYLRELQRYHSYGRGAIVYGYWGEPTVTRRLQTTLADRLPNHTLENSLSLLSAPKLISGPLRQLYHPSPKVYRDKQRLLTGLNLTKKQLELVDTLSWFTLFYEIGERVSSRLQDNLEEHLKRLVKNPKERELLQWYDPDSLANYFAGKRLSKGEIFRRQDFYVLITKSDKLQVLAGLKARSYFKDNFPQETVNNRTELKGTIASPGMARGKIRIVITVDEQKKMKRGDILVSTMTTPRLMSAVKKAAAIVTDEGGMTAHAAIVSREFGIPCIVGTKYATKVFKDGDLVEVDANKGIIKLIKQFMPRSPRTIWRSNFSIPRADMTLMAESQLGQYNLQDKTNGAKIIKRMLWVIKRGDNIAAYFDRDELRRMCEQTVKTILDKPAHIDKIHLQTASYNNKHFKFAETVRRRDLTKFSDKQLLQLHKKLWQLQYLAHCWSQPTTWFLDSDGEDYSRYLYDLTVAKVKSSPTLDAATAFSILTTPDKKSLSYIEEQESLRLLEFINGNKKVKQWFIAHQTRELVKDFSLLPPGIRSRLYAHYIKWRWTPYTYIGPAYELDYYLEVWRGLLREKLDPKKKLKQLTAKTKNIQAERKRLIKLLNLTPYQNHLFDIAAEIVWLKGFRKECYYHGYFVLDLVLGEMARRSGITLLQAKYLLPQELPLLFHGKSKQLAKIASDRWRFSVTYFNQGRQQVMAGAKAKNFLKKQRIEKTQVIKAEQLKGMCACPGNAKGVARVINVPADMPKMKAGDIMVSHNTYPSLVPAMKKAAAIITEEGGITCHAAIVSREMQIPCIVGVKGLLQALKDGDKLAVDATQGTIKVIKRK